MPNPSPDYWAGLRRRLDNVVGVLVGVGVLVAVVVIAGLLDRVM